MTNNTNDNVNLIHKRVITWKHIKSKQDTNQHYENKVWQRIHRMETNVVDCLDCKNAIRHYDDYSEIADITCQKNGKLIQNGMCGHCKDYEEVQEE